MAKNKSSNSKKTMSTRTKDIIFISLIFASVYIFLGSAISGGGFNASDNLASYSFTNYLEKADKDGEFPLWVPYIFSGTPSYSAMLTTGDRWWDFAYQIIFGFALIFKFLFNSDTARVAFWFALYGAGIYWMMRSKEKLPSVAFFSAFAAVFSTAVITWIMIGHNTKPIVLACLPFTFIFVEKLREKFSLIYLLLLVLSLHTMLEAGHVQMIFYSALALGIYLIFEVISRAISKKDPMSIVKVAGYLIGASIIAFVMSSDRYYSMLDYTEHSTRGSAPLVQEDENARDESGGNSYDYATMWSFSPGEMMGFLVPNYYGFGKLEYDIDENSGTILSQIARQDPNNKVPTYWGQKPIEDSAPYMGILIFFLALFGVFTNRKNVFVQFLAFLSLFALLLSFGYTLPILYDFFFYNVPMFNKFRAPSMILALVHFAFPILAGFGVSSLISWRKEGMDKDKKMIMNIFLIAIGAFFALAVLYNVGFESNYKSSVTNSDFVKNRMLPSMPDQYKEQFKTEYSDFVWSNMMSDWFTNAVLMLLAGALIYLFANNKIKKPILMGGLIVILVFDLWRVDSRPMDVAERSITDQVFHSKDWINFIKQDTDEKFRIADFVSPTPNAAAFWLLENVGGYHSAKLRVYQDMLDVTSGGSTSGVSNPFMWNLLNVKYIIDRRQIPGMRPVFQSQQEQAFVYLNPSYLPRAFFVDSVAVSDGLSILQKMKYDPSGATNFNPRSVVFLEDGLDNNIQPTTEANSVEITEYKNEKITLKANATGTNFLLLSEVYFPNWKAYVDGKETEIIKSNYFMRGLVLDKGNHTIELKYESPKFETGKTASLITNIIVVLALFGSLFMLWKEEKEKGEAKAEK